MPNVTKREAGKRDAKMLQESALDPRMDVTGARHGVCTLVEDGHAAAGYGVGASGR